MRLPGKVALITGAGRGIGRVIALAFAEEGADVVVVSRTPAEIEATAADIEAQGQRVLALQANISTAQDVATVVARTIDKLGTVHILVNNAGVQGPIGPMVDNDLEHWTRTVQTNLIGAFLCCRAVLPILIGQHWGRIINLSGGGASGPRANFSAYSACKAALVRLTETLAEEAGRYDVLVNAIAPGPVDTRMLDEVLEAGERSGGHELVQAWKCREGGGADPRMTAELAVFLASDAADGITGRLISALHDPWRAWATREETIPPSPWFTLRRIDPYTLRPLMGQLEEA